jgi:leucyl-tRNA synthetase
MLSRLQEHVKKATEAMEKLEARKAIHTILFKLDQDLQWYQKRAKTAEENAKASIIGEVLKTQVLMLTPFAPHICEELWEIMGGEGFASTAPWPKSDETKVDVKAEESEALIMKVLEDTCSIIRATKLTPRKMFYYTAAPWKWNVYLKALEKSMEGKITQNSLIKELLKYPELKAKAKEVIEFTNKIIDEVNQTPLERKQRLVAVGLINEAQTLKEAKDFLKSEIDAEITVYAEEDVKRYDPKNRARLAKPWRPAIYIE